MTVLFYPRAIVTLHSAVEPTDKEWQEYLAEAMPPQGQARPHLVFSQGGRPTAMQRKQMAVALLGREPRMAIMAESDMTRTMVRLIAPFNPAVRAFAEDNMAGARTYLGVSMTELPLTMPALSSFRRELARVGRGSVAA